MISKKLFQIHLFYKLILSIFDCKHIRPHTFMISSSLQFNNHEEIKIKNFPIQEYLLTNYPKVLVKSITIFKALNLRNRISACLFSLFPSLRSSSSLVIFFVIFSFSVSADLHKHGEVMKRHHEKSHNNSSNVGDMALSNATAPVSVLPYGMYLAFPIRVIPAMISPR